jgi:2-oxoglutarate dehydrogenase complex dehydrogenase (E1) component-like enzyme
MIWPGFACRLLCPALFSLPWTWGAFTHVQQQPAVRAASAASITSSQHLAAPSSRPLPWQQTSRGLHAVGVGRRCYSSSTHGSWPEAATAAASPLDIAINNQGACSSIASSSSASSHFEMSDTLTLAACIRRFRSRGHLVSQLDPLQRTPGGPWLGPIGDAYSR